MKFAQKLGYKGFPALKLALSETLAQPQAEPVVTVHNHILSSDTLKTVGEKLLAEKQAAARDAGHQQRRATASGAGHAAPRAG